MCCCNHWQNCPKNSPGWMSGWFGWLFWCGKRGKMLKEHILNSTCWLVDIYKNRDVMLVYGLLASIKNWNKENTFLTCHCDIRLIRDLNALFVIFVLFCTLHVLGIGPAWASRDFVKCCVFWLANGMQANGYLAHVCRPKLSLLVF